MPLKSFPKICPQCGCGFSTLYWERIYCSSRCAGTASRIRLGRSTAGIAYTCRECGKEWISNGRNRRTVFCSEKCDRRHRNRHYSSEFRKRARYHGVEYEPIKREEILERDNWICQLCGERIDKNLAYPDPHCPSLDHIIPMSLGGPHLKRNVHAAHWICNTLKRNNAVGEQLRLVG